MGINQFIFISLLIDIYTKDSVGELKSIFGIIYAWFFATGYGLPIVSYFWIKKVIKK